MLLKVLAQQAAQLGYTVRKSNTLSKQFLELDLGQTGPAELLKRVSRSELLVNSNELLHRLKRDILGALVEDRGDIWLEEAVGDEGDRC